MDYIDQVWDLTYAVRAWNSTLDEKMQVLAALYSAESAYERLAKVAAVLLLLSLLVYTTKRVSRWIYGFLYGIYYYEPDLEFLHHPPGDKLFGVRKSAKPSENISHSKGVPAALPNGWYFVCISSNLKKGQVKQFSMAGIELAVFRDEFGHVYALDAFCPHVGTNMAIGGTVHGSCLECPFHAWRFEGADGKCVHIPGANKIPDVAKVNSWPILERNKIIMVWFDAEDRDPLWMPSELPEIYEEGFEPYAQGTHYVQAHISEIPENGADIAHFIPVHKYNFYYGPSLEKVRSLKKTYLDHLWGEAFWETTDDWFVSRGGLRHDVEVFGRNFPPLVVHTTFNQYGPGIVHLKPTLLFGTMKLLLVMTVTPVSTFKQRIIHVAYGPPGFIGKLRSILALRAEGLMFERDCTLWHNKIYNQHGVLAATHSDELLVKFRRWFNQFYSESSKEKTCDKDLSW